MLTIVRMGHASKSFSEEAAGRFRARVAKYEHSAEVCPLLHQKIQIFPYNPISQGTSILVHLSTKLKKSSISSSPGSSSLQDRMSWSLAQRTACTRSRGWTITSFTQ